MTSAQIEVRRQYTAGEETALIAAVQTALHENLKTPEHQHTVRLLVHQPHRFAAPHNLTRPECFTLIGIDLPKGRSLVTKKRLCHAIAARLEALGIPRDHVHIVLREIRRDNPGIGGLAASEAGRENEGDW